MKTLQNSTGKVCGTVFNDSEPRVTSVQQLHILHLSARLLLFLDQMALRWALPCFSFWTSSGVWLYGFFGVFGVGLLFCGLPSSFFWFQGPARSAILRRTLFDLASSVWVPAGWRYNVFGYTWSDQMSSTKSSTKFQGTKEYLLTHWLDYKSCFFFSMTYKTGRD